MKIQLSLLFLGLLAGRAAAFQSKVPEPQPEQARAAENSLENMFYGFHAMDAQGGQYRYLRGAAAGGMPVRVLHHAAAGRAGEIATRTTF
jgi:hypothetical protein